MELTLKQKISRYIKKILRSYRGIPDKKVYIEFITALLSIPVLLTVILLNLNNLQGDKKDDKPSPTPAQQIIYVSPSNKDEPTPVPDDSVTCVKGLGDVSISSPEEGEVVTENPVNVIVDYEAGKFCDAVWSHRINNGSWSNYDDKSIALYNLPQGRVQLDLRVRSIAGGSHEKTISRVFTYRGPTTSQVTPPVASNSAN